MYICKLKADFASTDLNGDGFVTREEILENAAAIEYYLTADELEATMRDYDIDHDGKISLDEFIAATVSAYTYGLFRYDVSSHTYMPRSIMFALLRVGQGKGREQMVTAGILVNGNPGSVRHGGCCIDFSGLRSFNQ